MSDEPLSARSRAVFGLAGAGVIAAAAVAVALGSTPSHGGSTYYRAAFSRAGQGLDPQKSDVKIRGITVGTVDRIDLSRDGRVQVRIRVDKGVKIPQSTSARIEPLSVFGPKDIALDLGPGEQGGPYLADGGRIAKTSDPQELSDTAWPTYRLTKAINPDELATILHTFSAGLNGQGPALRRTLENGGKVIDAAHANRAVISRLISDLTGLSGTLASRGDTVVKVAGDFNDIAPVVYERPDKVQQLLGESGRLADTVGGTLQRQGRNVGEIIDGGAKTLRVLSQERRNVPVLLDSLNGFFNLLSQIIRVPGPNGTTIAQAVNTLPLDLCQTLVDVCPRPPATTAFDQKVKSGPRMVVQP
ncbi:MlaD family protein [Actinomadura hibisca]|uniref:MlaD family protein n=1 Tax=Actinomadura hibisca TaxID=68565 RepID=UPI0008375D1E|nr:MlaD family protein [Actinomadura hibisca]